MWAPPARPMIPALGKQNKLRQLAAVRASAQDVGMLLAAAADEAAKAAEAVKPGSVEAPSGETDHAHGVRAHREPRAAMLFSSPLKQMLCSACALAQQ